MDLLDRFNADRRRHNLVARRLRIKLQAQNAGG